MVNEGPVTAPLNFNVADETSASLEQKRLPPTPRSHNPFSHDNSHTILYTNQQPGQRQTNKALTYLACRAGEIFSSERSHRKKFSRHLEFFMQWKTGERKKETKHKPR